MDIQDIKNAAEKRYDHKHTHVFSGDYTLRIKYPGAVLAITKNTKLDFVIEFNSYMDSDVSEVKKIDDIHDIFDEFDRFAKRQAAETLEALSGVNDD